ncbi:uncharacterized protein LOC127699955 isoform X2 [Mytilus californianus]|uniref:uncharacterized protein LOC127699955 isoform X2 n=1 Tax=Mytilus californianus TaxID=6549 RepID=UPI002246FA52|nr:uncharacterized protein LOC127699955 isoform X2 [Mytilus californianus]
MYVKIIVFLFFLAWKAHFVSLFSLLLILSVTSDASICGLDAGYDSVAKPKKAIVQQGSQIVPKNPGTAAEAWGSSADLPLREQTLYTAVAVTGSSAINKQPDKKVSRQTNLANPSNSDLILEVEREKLELEREQLVIEKEKISLKKEKLKMLKDAMQMKKRTLQLLEEYVDFKKLKFTHDSDVCDLLPIIKF